MNQFELHPQLAADSHFVADLPLCQLRLLDDSQYPWLILVPRQAAVKEIIDLSWQEQQQLWWESAWLSQRLQQSFRPTKLNVAALGNMVSQLHLHHVARFEGDAAWPAPIWGKQPMQRYTAEALQARLDICLQWSTEPLLRHDLPA